MPPFVADLIATDDPLARSVARLVAVLARQEWHFDGPAPVKVSTLAKRFGPVEPGAVESLVASGFAVRVRDGADPIIRPTGLALAVGGFAATALTLPDLDQNGEPAPPLLLSLARTGLPSVPAEGLAFHLGQEVDELWAELGPLVAAGLVALWPDHPAGPAAALTPYAAEALGLRLASDGSRWLRLGDPDPTAARRATPDDEDDGFDPIGSAVDGRELGGLDGLILAELIDDHRRQRFEAIDRITSPEARHRRAIEERRQTLAETIQRRKLAEATRRLSAAERKAQMAELEKRLFTARLTRPIGPPEGGDRVDFSPIPLPPLRILVGLRSAWPIPVGPREAWHPWRPSDGPCPECEGKPLGRLVVCLHCHRSGLDHLIGPPRHSPMAGQTRVGKARAAPTKSGSGLKGGIG